MKIFQLPYSLALRARKSEIRISKFETYFFDYWNFEHSDLFRISNLEFRISPTTVGALPPPLPPPQYIQQLLLDSGPF